MCRFQATCLTSRLLRQQLAKSVAAAQFTQPGQTSRLVEEGPRWPCIQYPSESGIEWRPLCAITGLSIGRHRGNSTKTVCRLFVHRERFAVRDTEPSVVLCLKTSAAYERNFLALRTETEKKFPRKKSLTDIRPAYNCLRKHLQQTDVFHEKTKKMLRKELLELEILNSRIKCIDKLVQSELQKLE
nr:uncharacterized protein LOC117218951 [Megalopta genalis]